jgi:hypothetical protein
VEAIEKLDLPILPHLPYSADLVPYNFHFYQKTKEVLCGHVYDSDEEVERTARTWMKKQNVELFCDGFEKLVRRRWKFVKNGGDDVEK